MADTKNAQANAGTVEETLTKAEIEERVLDLAMEHPAFEHVGHRVGIEMCDTVAQRCDGDYSEANILRLMDSMVRVETEEEKARRKEWNDRVTAELEADLAELLGTGADPHDPDDHSVVGEKPRGNRGGAGAPNRRRIDHKGSCYSAKHARRTTGN